MEDALVALGSVFVALLLAAIVAGLLQVRAECRSLRALVEDLARRLAPVTPSGTPPGGPATPTGSPPPSARAAAETPADGGAPDDMAPEVRAAYQPQRPGAEA